MSINTLYEASSIAMCVDEENIWLVDERSINLFVKSKIGLKKSFSSVVSKYFSIQPRTYFCETLSNYSRK